MTRFAEVTDAAPASVLHRAHDVRLEERMTPQPAPHEVLVEIAAVGVCGSDVHYYEEGRIGQYVVEQPLVLGHEAAGVVVRCGDEATRHAPGQRVAIEPGVPCGHCHACRAGHYNLCPYVKFFATPPVDGAFTRYVTIHEDFAHPIPDTVSDVEGALLEPLSVALWGVWKGEVHAGDNVLVTGAGPVGLLTAQVARASGAHVTVTDVAADRLALAERLGAARTIDVGAQPLAASDVAPDVLLECSGHPAAVADGIRAVRPAGRVVLIGIWPEPDFSLPVQAIQNREIEITGTFRYANTYPAAIGLVASGAVDLNSLVTSHHGLAQVEEALTAARGNPSAVKAIVHPTVEVI